MVHFYLTDNKEVDVSYSGLKKERKIALVSAGSHYFGNWGKAVIAAGLPYQEIRKRKVGCFTKGEILDRP